MVGGGEESGWWAVTGSLKNDEAGLGSKRGQTTHYSAEEDWMKTCHLWILMDSPDFLAESC